MTTVSEQPTEIQYNITQRYLNGPLGPMRYWESHPKRGLPVLLIHGYGALIEHWRAVMRPIARNHALYALDLYGFGASARPTSPPSKETWAAQAATLIREVIKEPTVVVGHSMGGVVTAALARGYPELVRGLALVNSSGLQDPNRPLTPTDRFLLNLIGAPVVGEALSGVLGTPWGVRQGLMSSYHRKERVTPELIETFSRPLRTYGAGSYLAVSRSITNLVLDLQPGEVRAPALLLWGVEDRSNPPDNTEAIKARMLPQAEIQLLPNSGHCPFDEDPDAFCAALLPWLARL